MGKDSKSEVRINALLIATICLMLAACGRLSPAPGDSVAGSGDTSGQQPPDPTATLPPTPTTTVTPPATPTPPVIETPFATATAQATATGTPMATATTDPYAGLTIEDLASRSYGGGQLTIEETLQITESFTRTLVSYPSDGLKVYGFMNVPFGDGPFPVALVLHGYIPPQQYRTMDYTTRYADMLARAGYLVLHPNYRNHPPSDETEAFTAGEPEADFRVGYAVDMLNLLALIQAQGGQPGPLEKANTEQIHLLGHSMGGGIALRIITVNSDVNAAVLYGAMSGDEVKNFERILEWSNGQSGDWELSAPVEALQRISPIYHLSRIQAAVSVHHGALDEIVPAEWSWELCGLLRDLGKVVECFNYPDAPHSFHDEVDRLFQQRVIDFFERY